MGAADPPSDDGPADKAITYTDSQTATTGTAVGAALIFLDTNGYELSLTIDELEQIIVWTSPPGRSTKLG